MRLAISNLSPQTSSDDLMSVLTEFGKVKAIVLQPRSYDCLALVEMPNETEAVAVLQHLNGDIINGLPLQIEIVQKAASAQDSLDFSPTKNETEGRSDDNITA